MKQYLQFLNHIMDNGEIKEDRTATGTKSLFGYQMRYNLQDGFPLVTTKRMAKKAIIHELIWFISGNTNIKYLVDNNIKIWNEWPYDKYKKSNDYQNETLKEFVSKIKNDQDFADKHGDLGPVYGKQWRSFEGRDKKIVDQLTEVIQNIKTNPDSRRHIVTAWNPAEIEDMALPPCHMMFQFYVSNNKLSLQLYQRSADSFLGVPFNIASYSLLLTMVAHVCDLEVGDFVHTIGDAHIYSNHFDQVALQTSRTPLPLPKLIIKRKVTSIDDFKFEDFEIVDYQSHGKIVGDIAV